VSDVDNSRKAEFWASVKVTQSCWPWTRPCRSKLGPRFAYDGQDVKVGRMAFFFHHGFWPSGGAVRSCGNPLCCKPEHIMDVPQKDVPEFLKVRGRHSAGRRPRRSECKNGHPFDEKNTGQSKTQRFCRVCSRAANMRFYYRNRRPVDSSVSVWERFGRMSVGR
jgi:hypothetical protein